jgi:outer membrane protein assembly factor BamD (BamD/ComL family)
MTASRPNRRQTAADKRRTEIALIENSILAFERILEKYPTDRFNEDRKRQMEMLKDKLAMMTATA